MKLQKIKKKSKIIHTDKLVFGKSYNPIVITDWDFYLNVAKESFNRRLEYEGPSYLTYTSFHIMKTLANGKYCKIMLAAKEDDDNLYALKVVSLSKIKKLRLIDVVMNEKKILNAIRFQFTIYLEGFFTHKNNLYFVLPLLAGGDLFNFLQRKGILDESVAKFYAAQILLALEYLHNLDIIYRDLKPESIMIEHTGYIKLTAFSLAKMIPNNRTYTLCGTPEYLAPEILRQEGYGKSADWWAFACVIFELCCGISPFYSDDIGICFNRIVAGRFYPPVSSSLEFKDLMRNLLKINVTDRLGNLKGGADDIREHDWFSSIGWLSILNRMVTPPYIPKKDEVISYVYYHEYIIDKYPDTFGEEAGGVDDKKDISKYDGYFQQFG